jgi:hypothetical protein
MAMSRDTEDDWSLWDASSAEERISLLTIPSQSKMPKRFETLTDLIRLGLSEVGPRTGSSDPNCSLSPSPDPGRCMLFA